MKRVAEGEQCQLPDLPYGISEGKRARHSQTSVDLSPFSLGLLFEIMYIIVVSGDKEEQIRWETGKRDNQAKTQNIVHGKVGATRM